MPATPPGETPLPSLELLSTVEATSPLAFSSALDEVVVAASAGLAVDRYGEVGSGGEVKEVWLPVESLIHPPSESRSAVAVVDAEAGAVEVLVLLQIVQDDAV
jgi:hypothetical protein